jgi:hypothetical protein
MKIRAELQKGATGPVDKSPNAGVGVAQAVQAPALAAPAPASILPSITNGPVVIEKMGAEPLFPEPRPVQQATEVPAAPPIFPEPRQVQMGGPVLEIEDVPIEEIGGVGGEETVKYPPQQPMAMEGGWSEDANVKVIKL